MRQPDDANRRAASLPHPQPSRPQLIVLSHLRWDFVFQRPQHLMSRAARSHDVWFIEEPLFEGEQPAFRELVRAGGVRVIQPLLPPGTSAETALAHQGAIAGDIASRRPASQVVLWYYTPMALAFGRDIAADAIVFDKMDELSAFAFAPPELRAFEQELMARADLVFTGGASLYAAARDRAASVHCFPSSIDSAHFAGARDRGTPDPADQAGIARPRLGFFGVIDERIDLGLIAAVAAARPDWQLVNLGPTAKIDPASLPQAPNIHWLGAKPYAELPAYMAHWDLGWMPFALNASTRFISPTKTPEFLAAGLPVISTPIHDVVEPYGRRGLVAIASNTASVVEWGDRLLAERADSGQRAARLALVDGHLAGGSWDATWQAMQALISERLAAAAPATLVRNRNPLEAAHV